MVVCQGFLHLGEPPASAPRDPRMRFPPCLPDPQSLVSLGPADGRDAEAIRRLGESVGGFFTEDGIRLASAKGVLGKTSSNAMLIGL